MSTGTLASFNRINESTLTRILACLWQELYRGVFLVYLADEAGFVRRLSRCPPGDKQRMKKMYQEACTYPDVSRFSHLGGGLGAVLPAGRQGIPALIMVNSKFL